MGCSRRNREPLIREGQFDDIGQVELGIEAQTGDSEGIAIGPSNRKLTGMDLIDPLARTIRHGRGRTCVDLTYSDDKRRSRLGARLESLILWKPAPHDVARTRERKETMRLSHLKQAFRDAHPPLRLKLLDPLELFRGEGRIVRFVAGELIPCKLRDRKVDNFGLGHA